MVVNTAHTPAKAAGLVFDMIKPKMGALWHCLIVDGFIEPIFEDVQSTYSGAVTLCQDLTVFNVTPGGVEARMARVNPVQGVMVGPSNTEPSIDPTAATPPPAWWAGAAIDWQSKLN